MEHEKANFFGVETSEVTQKTVVRIYWAHNVRGYIIASLLLVALGVGLTSFFNFLFF